MKYKRIDIYYFSGTGNTFLVINKIADVLRSKGFNVNLMKIEKKPEVLLEDNLLIGLAFPVHLQSTNKFVWDFFYNLPNVYSMNIDVFMADTMASFSGGIVGPLKMVLKNKGYNCIGAKEFRMPSNYTKQNFDKNRLIIEKSLEEAENFAIDLINGKIKWRRAPIFSDFMRLFSKFDLLWKVFRKIISVDNNKCSKCGICAKICPVGAISYSQEGFPIITDKCIICVRCVNYCPSNAFMISKKHIPQYKPVELKHWF